MEGRLNNILENKLREREVVSFLNNIEFLSGSEVKSNSPTALEDTGVVNAVLETKNGHQLLFEFVPKRSIRRGSRYTDYLYVKGDLIFIEAPVLEFDLNQDLTLDQLYDRPEWKIMIDLICRELNLKKFNDWFPYVQSKSEEGGYQLVIGRDIDTPITLKELLRSILSIGKAVEGIKKFTQAEFVKVGLK